MPSGNEPIHSQGSTMSDWEGTFARYLDTECGYTAHTVVTYGRVVQDFLAFLGSRSVELGNLCREDVSAYVFRLCTERGNGARSVRLKLQIIKAFLNFLREYHGGAAPRLELGPKDFNYKVEQQDAQSFSEEQLTALMESANECCRAARERLDEAGGGATKLFHKQFLGALRDRALLALLIATGLRIAEALGICLDDFDDVEQTILIRGKGKKLRKVFFDLDVLQEHLLPYLEARKALDLSHDRLFVSSKSYAPLGSRGVQKRLKDYLRAAGLRTSASPHTLRHSFATVAIEKGANIKAVSQIMGHSSCRITIDLYTHLSNEHLRAVMQRCNPLATAVIPLAERIETRKRNLAYLEATG